MLTRLHIENYKAIDKLTLEFRSKNLLMGLNGSGKSSVFEVLAGIKALVVGEEKVKDVFSLATVPQWLQNQDSSVRQRFELTLEVGSSRYEYGLTLVQIQQGGRSHIAEESLSRNSERQLWIQGGEAALAGDGSVAPVEVEHSGHRSVFSLGMKSRAKSYQSQLAFREFLAGAHVFHLDPGRMTGLTRSPESQLTPDFSNFSSWYRRASLVDASAASLFLGDAREAIGGLRSLDYHDLGQGVMALQARIEGPPDLGLGTRRGNGDYILPIDALSEGQRALVGLYAATRFLAKEGAILCFDEPDNYLALAEIQPWLTRLLDLSDDRGGQFVIASHHPELINLLAPDYGIVLERDGSAPTSARTFSAARDCLLPAAEQVARGWA